MMLLAVNLAYFIYNAIKYLSFLVTIKCLRFIKLSLLIETLSSESTMQKEANLYLRMFLLLFYSLTHK